MNQTSRTQQQEDGTPDKTRRTFIKGFVGSGLVLATAGCTSSGSQASTTTETTSTSTPTTTTTETTTQTTTTTPTTTVEAPDGVAGVGVSAVTQTTPIFDWFEDKESNGGILTGYSSAKDAKHRLNNLATETTEFIEATDFETSHLLVVESVGPTTCHDILAITDVGLSNGMLQLTAETKQSTSGDCTDETTFPKALVRFEFESQEAMVNEVKYDVTNGWGYNSEVTHTIRA